MTKPGIHFIDPPRPDNRVVAAEFSGKATAEDISALAARLKPIVDRGEKANLLIDMHNYEGSEFGVAGEKFKHMGTFWKGIDKYAIVGAPRWTKFFSSVLNPVTPQNMKNFEPEETNEAWSWVLHSE
ncbi:MAG: SpoIIAA family protein [Planctomycetota bacterium]